MQVGELEKLVKHPQRAALVGLQHMLELRGEKDVFVHVNSVYLTFIVENHGSKSGKKALLIVFQVVFYFLLL